MGYKIISLGEVIEDKPDGSDVIKVVANDLLYDQPSGVIGDYKETIKGDIPSLKPGTPNTEHEVTSIIEAVWRSIGASNRVTAPDVRRNMRVALWQYHNSQEIYWDVVGREPGLMGKEDVVFAFSNQPGGGDGEAYDLPSSVFLRINTKLGYVELSTPNNGGEPTTFQAKINFKEGNWTINDGKGNHLNMDAVKGNMFIKVNEEFRVDAKSFIFNGDNWTSKLKTLIEQLSQTKTTTAKDVTYNSPVTINEMLILKGGLTAAGGTGSAVTITGNTVMNGDITVTGKATGDFPGHKI